jgi:hypothetical protein
VHDMSTGATGTRVSYCYFLTSHMKPMIRPKHRGVISTGVLLQHYNARTGTYCRVTAETIEDIHFQRLFTRRSHLTSLTVTIIPLDHSQRPLVEISRSDKEVTQVAAATKCAAKGIFPTWNPGSCKAVDMQ